MAERNKPRVPLVAVVVGGLLAGAGLFGLFRGAQAEPVPEALPPVKLDDPRPDPFGALPVPALPSVPVAPSPPVQQTGFPPITPSVPSVPKIDVLSKPVEPLPIPVPDATRPSLPPLPAPTADLPKPVDPIPAPKPVDPLPLPAPKPVDAVPLPKPDVLPLPTPVVEPKPEPAPAALPPAKIDPIPEPKLEPVLPKPVDPVLKPVDPLPKPVDALLPMPVAPKPADPLPVLPKPVETPQPVTPVEPVAPVPPAKPENNLRPEPAPLTVNPVLPPVGTETLPPPRKVGDEVAPPPRPVVEESVTPMPKPTGVVPVAVPFTPGPTPMTASRSTLLTAVLGAALASAPAFAEDPKPGDPKPVDAKVIEALQKDLKDLKADVDLLKAQKKELNEQINGRVDGKGVTAAEKGLVKRLEESEKAGKEMAEKIKDLEKSLALAQKSVSEKQPIGGTGGTGTVGGSNSGTVVAGKGTVKLINEYNAKVSMMVNGISYPLAVNEVKDVLVPEGDLKYELVEFPNATAKKTTIKEGEVVTLRIK